MLLGCIATVLVLAPQAELPGYGALPWMLVALLIPLCYGVESIYVAARWPEGLDVMQVGFGEALAAAILTAPLLLLSGEPQSLVLQASIAEFAILVFVLFGVFEVFMYFYLVRTTGGVLVFSETHDATTWFAVIVLVAALALVSADSIRQARSA